MISYIFGVNCTL